MKIEANPFFFVAPVPDFLSLRLLEARLPMPGGKGHQPGVFRLNSMPSPEAPPHGYRASS